MVVVDYPPYLSTIPGVLLIEVPERQRGKTLIQGRYTFMLYESASERDEQQADLNARPLTQVQSYWWQKPSTRMSEAIFCSVHEPPRFNLPYFVVTRWAAPLAARFAEPGLLNRGCYTVEHPARQSEALDIAAKVASLVDRMEGECWVLSPDSRRKVQL